MGYEYFHDAEEFKICSECIGDAYLKNEIEEVHDSGTCSYCAKSGNVVSLQELGDRVHDVLYEQFYLTASQPEGIEYTLAKEGVWEREGSPVTEVIGEITGLDYQIAEDIRAYLSDVHGYIEVKDGGEDPYADDAQYEERGPDSLNFHDTWESFSQRVRWRSRFFSQYAEVDLDSIFGNLEKLRTYDGRPVIRSIGPEVEDRFVFRARIAFTHKELEKFLKNPARELASPPPRNASAGRMNAAGISVFYGALDANTCVAEIRAPVGSSVVLGQFELIKEVQLLDLDALAEVYVEGSHFDREIVLQRGRATFLNHLASLIARPVMPNDEAFEYLPTQVVAEYLATKGTPKLDGMLYRSSQTGGQGRNLVLFNPSSLAEPDGLPVDTDYSFLFGSGPEDDPDHDIFVFEKLPPDEVAVERKEVKVFGMMMPIPDFEMEPDSDDEIWLQDREPTLRLKRDDVKVLNISGVQYSFFEQNVRRYQSKKTDKEPF